MQKIPTLFKRDPDDMSRVLDEVTPECEWVLAGEGVPTVKWDGTACLWRDGKLWKRYELRPGKTPPADFGPTGEPGPTGRQPGWVPVGDGPEDKWHREALGAAEGSDRAPHDRLEEECTYELLGPKVQGNPYSLQNHVLFRHGVDIIVSEDPRSFDTIRRFLQRAVSEGIVWHHADGRMAKIKRRDFGFRWPTRQQ